MTGRLGDPLGRSTCRRCYRREKPRVLQYIDMWGEVPYPTDNRRSTVNNGILHYFFNLLVDEDTIAPEYDKIEQSPIDFRLRQRGLQ